MTQILKLYINFTKRLIEQIHRLLRYFFKNNKNYLKIETLKYNKKKQKKTKKKKRGEHI